jgi:hypothetical protein
MKVGHARVAATEWVQKYASRMTGFQGAYFSGSTIWQADDAEMPSTSDIDVMVIIDESEPPPKLGKFVYRESLIEVSYLSWNQLASADEVLTSYHLANSFRVDTIIADPSGQLRRLQKQVSRQFSEIQWVRRRCENVRQKIENGLQGIDTLAPMHDQVTQWLFSTGVTTHLLLVAALRNPTVRLRYLAARHLLIEYGFDDFYPELLKLLGCADLTPGRVEHHVHELAQTFDTAAVESRTPFLFSTDITAAARPIVIDGSRELIRSGYHQEAVFWIVATFARCHKILAADAPHLQRTLAPAFDEVIADLGITSADTILKRSENVLQFLPKLWEITEQILFANPLITK